MFWEVSSPHICSPIQRQRYAIVLIIYFNLYISKLSYIELGIELSYTKS